ncbi:MAG TPA: hypothetical protein VFM27_16610 [Acidimicrobiales bacterium]|nr:hypothetical protein [Acidimicrobiales bacterium]
MAGLDEQVAQLYGGPLDEFVAARDALVRELRAAGDKERAAEVKALRKPRALAWALDAAGLAAPDTVADLAAAAGAVGAAQSGDGDVRAAVADLRAAERRVVEAAAAAAERHGQRVDPAALGGAVRAVIADPGALADLRAVRLVDTPDAGGLGLALPGGEPAQPRPEKAARPPSKARPRSTAKAPAGPAATRAARATEPEPAGPDPAVLRTARRELAAAERALRTATNTARREADTAADVEARAAAARRKADDAAQAEAAARDRLDEARAALADLEG